MAAAVYLHNALFSHSTLTPTQNSPNNNNDNDHDRRGSSPSEDSAEYHDAVDEEISENIIGNSGDAQQVQRADHRRADISTSSLNPNSNVGGPVRSPGNVNQGAEHVFNSTGDMRTIGDVHDSSRDHGRKSSESTLVPFLSPWRRWRRDPGADASNVVREGEDGVTPMEVDTPFSNTTQYFTPDEQPTPTFPNPNPSNYIDLSHSPNPDSLRNSPLPPGLPAATSSTSRRQPTPYPFPPLGPPSHYRTSSSSSVDAYRSRPKGRRRPLTTSSNPPISTLHPNPNFDPNNPDINQSTTNNNNAYSVAFRNSPLGRLIRKGRIPNPRLSRRTRIWILIVRGALGSLLCGWAAYSCARYWLAYSEFHPTPSNSNTPVPKDDPPRSQYAFTLAIATAIAAGLLALDLGCFLYFVLYPLDARPIQRTPTIAPIARNDSTAPAIDDSTRPRPLPESKTQTDANNPPDSDNDKSKPNKTSMYSTTSAHRRSRRLSKTRPESSIRAGERTEQEHGEGGEHWPMGVGYPPVAMPPGLGLDPRGEMPLGLVPDHLQPVESAGEAQEVQEERRAEPEMHQRERELGDETRPSSQYVSGDEAPPPKVERHDRSTYKLHLPIACQEGNISPLPMLLTTSNPTNASTSAPLAPMRYPPELALPTVEQAAASANAPGFLNAVTRSTGTNTGVRASRMSTKQPTVIRRKWVKTRRLLHAIHWLAFIALNIPAFVNVALVPIWYNPSPTSPSGVNSTHRLSGLCRWSPDVIWAGTALPPAYPPGCAHTVSYRAWLWGAIGRVLITFFLCLIWIVFDGLWWGAWVVGTRNIGWRGSVPVPISWTPRSRRNTEEAEAEDHADDTADESEAERKRGLKEGGLWSRVRLLSGASKASARSAKSARSHKEKYRESVSTAPPAQHVERIDLSSPMDPLSANTSVDALGATTPGSDSAMSPSSIHKVRRKPVRQSSPPTSSYFPPSAFEPLPMERQPLTGGVGSRRPSAHDSIGGSTIVGSPLAQTYLASSPPLSGSSHAGHGMEDRNSAAFGRRSIGLEMLSELDREGSTSEVPQQLQQRPASRLARYDDNNVYGDKYSPPTPPSPHSSTYPPSSNRRSWTADLNAFSPVNSPEADDPLLGRGYFMVGDGGFSAGNSNEGAYDEESYYRSVNAGTGVGPLQRNNSGERAASPMSDRSVSPTSYGHGHIAAVDVRVDSPTIEGEVEEGVEDQRFDVANSQVPWFIHPTANPSTPPQLIPATYQHPLAQGIQMALGRPAEPFEREIRMLGGVVRRMSTIESFGSHERDLDLSRRGSAGTGRTNQTGRGAGAARDNTSGSGNSNGRRPGTGGSGSAEHSAEKTTEEEAVVQGSPTEITPP